MCYFYFIIILFFFLSVFLRLSQQRTSTGHVWIWVCLSIRRRAKQYGKDIHLQQDLSISLSCM